MDPDTTYRIVVSFGVFLITVVALCLIWPLEHPQAVFVKKEYEPRKAMVAEPLIVPDMSCDESKLTIEEDLVQAETDSIPNPTEVSKEEAFAIWADMEYRHIIPNDSIGFV